MLRRTMTLAQALLLILGYSACAGERFKDERSLPPMISFDQPGYLQRALDPVLGTSFVKVTDPGNGQSTALPCRQEYCRHRYSSSQAWNADQSLLLIRHGCDGFCFLDGRTYEAKFRRRESAQCEWSPRDSELMICVSEQKVYTWAPNSNVRSNVAYFREFRKLGFGFNKGNPSNDGLRIVVVAAKGSGELKAFAYDIKDRKRYGLIDLPVDNGRMTNCSISASGKLIYCTRNIAGRLEAFVYTLKGEQVQHWTEHHRPGHGDLALDEDGSDIYVGVSKSGPDRLRVIKRRLSDGAVTILSGRSHAQHVSARNIHLPGWVFVTFSGSRDEMRGSFEPYYQEVVALRTNGGGETRRLARTRSVRHDYRSEAHGSPSPDGSRIIWASNWGVAGGPVASYVSRVDWRPPQP